MMMRRAAIKNLVMEEEKIEESENVFMSVAQDFGERKLVREHWVSVGPVASGYNTRYGC